MSLIDTLRTAIDDIPPSHQPANATDAIGLVGSVIAYLEHGAENFVKAVESGGVAGLYKDAEQLEAEQQAGKSAEELQVEVEQLKAQLAAAQGVNQQTTVGAVSTTSTEPAAS